MLKKIFNLRVSLSAILVLLTVSCSKVGPAAFWKEFKPKHIKTSNSDQGPFGGTTIIDWSFNSPIPPNEIIAFAGKNEWELVDSFVISHDSVLNIDTKNNYQNQILKDKAVAKLNFEQYRIFLFKTSWIAVEPGNLSKTDHNGFAILNENNTFFRVYHIWGE